MVESITVVEQSQSMYNLTVDQAHTFFVGDGQWLVHNECHPYWGEDVPDTPHLTRIDPERPGGPHPDWSIDTSNFDSPPATTTSNGGLRDSKQFWKAWAEQDQRLGRQTLSEENLARVEKGISPFIDKTWVEHFPEHAGALDAVGDDRILVHHHVDYGPDAVPVPGKYHRGSEKVFHP